MCPFSVRCCVVSIKYQTKLYISLTDSLEDKRCTGSAVRLWEPEGFLQNPDYPAAGEYTACHWRIEPSPRTSVHLVLHDLASARRSHGRCDGGLHISAYKCDTDKRFYTRRLCASDHHSNRPDQAGDGQEDNTDQMKIVSCGPVDVRLTPARDSYPLRFWLGYSVKDSVRLEPVHRSLWHAGLLSVCSESSVTHTEYGVVGGHLGSTLTATMTTSYNQSMTSASGVSDDGGSSDQENTMTILVVLVCVIGLIAITLAILLIIVCIKRRPKVELIEHVYAVPGACQTLSHTYTGDNPPDPGPRPRLVQPYCDVADARPPGQPLQPTPASPAYAEVEEVCDVEPDENNLRRFHFRSRPSRPSVSSTSGSSAHYEDICPVPITAPAYKNSLAASKNSTLPTYKTPSNNKMVAVGSSNSPAVKNNVNAGSNHYSTTGTRAGRPAQPDSVSIPSAREKHVYVHVVDSDGNSDTGKSKPQTLNSKTQTDTSAAVAPIVARFINNTTDSKPSGSKVPPRGTTDTPSSRLYPLQEGRVASLVSTLNRTKKATKMGESVNEQTKAVS
ncbi:uncharacterized protein [Littorina saxatilis]|uniref:uncharacterized protein n=1 Tax=Littorina saxatilis TaxID=31220 RepID=UPI0038B5D267